MVAPLGKPYSKLDSTFILTLVAVTLVTIVMSWFIITYLLNEVVQEILYPYSTYPVVVFSTGDILIFPGWAVMCLVTLLGINEAALRLLGQPRFVKIKAKILKYIAIILVISVIFVVVDYIVWQVAARSNGYTQCPSGTLLLGHKVSSAWAKDEALCYSKEVKYLLPTGTHQQVVEVAEYLNKKQ